jgi:lipopolysaccharide transport system ATP-binding protein
MTGRENILNSAILGMTKTDKLDEIIEFSGCEAIYRHTGKTLQQRNDRAFGFAVAAFLEPDILIIDEVLAVGDAEFKRRPLGRCRIFQRGGRTVLFVSHNMAYKTVVYQGIVLEGCFEVRTDDLQVLFGY